VPLSPGEDGHLNSPRTVDLDEAELIAAAPDHEDAG